MPPWAKPEEKSLYYVSTAEAVDDKSAGPEERDGRVIEDAVFGTVGADGKGPNFRSVSLLCAGVDRCSLVAARASSSPLARPLLATDMDADARSDSGARSC